LRLTAIEFKHAQGKGVNLATLSASHFTP
jgi:hypothetical protein